jgi:hypothetical protein
MNLDMKLNELLQEVYKVFPAERVSEEDVCNYVDWETKTLIPVFSGMNWHEFGSDMVLDYPSALSYLSKIAFRQFFPAYFVDLLRNFSVWSEVLVTIIFVLTPSQDDIAEYRKLDMFRLDSFSAQESAVIIEFLEMLLEIDKLNDEHQVISESLNNYWYVRDSTHKADSRNP